MPKAFASAGWLVAIILTGVLCLMRLVYVDLLHNCLQRKQTFSFY